MDAEEQEAINELKAMSREELDNVEYTLKKWICGCKGCNGGTKVRDYGIYPEYYWPRKDKGWMNVHASFFMCGKHYPRLKKMANLYGWEKVIEKMIDRDKTNLENVNFTKSNKLNS